MLVLIAAAHAAPEGEATAPPEPSAKPCETAAEVAAAVEKGRREAGPDAKVVRGVVGGTLCPGESVPSAHWSGALVRTRPRVDPSDYPSGQTGDAQCVVHMFVDTKGEVADAIPADTCPEAFRASARRIAFRCAFHPVTDPDGTPRKMKFDLAINFHPPD